LHRSKPDPELSRQALQAHKEKMRRKGKVLVVGAEENPALPIVESLYRKGLEVHVASHKRICVGFFSRFVHERFLYPSPYTNEQAFVECLSDHVRKQRFDVTFVTGDRATDLLASHRSLFTEHTSLPLVDLDRYVNCRDKTKTMKLAQRIGVPTPQTYYPENESLLELASKLAYPVVLKPNSSDGARGISYPQTAQELVCSYHKTVANYGPCHIQEYIPQTGMQYKAELLLDENSNVKAWCVYNKLRYYPPSGGSSTLNSTVERKDILQSAANILKALRWYGMGDCDFIEDPRDGTAKLMEINPRFTRSIKICVLAGVDFPYLLYKLAVKEPFESVLDYRIGTFLRYLPADINWFIKSKDRFKAAPKFFSGDGKKITDEIFSLKDPGPGIAFLFSKVLSRFDQRQQLYHFQSSSA
jgi:predicted ATP-grasp superfamily ATP-dependent carboligase